MYQLYGYAVYYYNPLSFNRDPDNYGYVLNNRFLSLISTYGYSNTNPNRYISITSYNNQSLYINLNTSTTYHIKEIIDFENNKYQMYINNTKCLERTGTGYYVSPDGSNIRVEFYKGNYETDSMDIISNLKITSEP